MENTKQIDNFKIITSRVVNDKKVPAIIRATKPVKLVEFENVARAEGLKGLIVNAVQVFVDGKPSEEYRSIDIWENELKLNGGSEESRKADRIEKLLQEVEKMADGTVKDLKIKFIEKLMSGNPLPEVSPAKDSSTDITVDPANTDLPF